MVRCGDKRGGGQVGEWQIRNGLSQATSPGMAIKYLPKIKHATDPLLLSIAMTLTVGLDFESNCPPLDLSQFRLDVLAYLVGILPTLDMLATTQPLSQVLVAQGLAGNSPNFYAAAIRGCRNK